MKKILSILLMGVLVISLTGCGTEEIKEQTLVCTTTETEDGIDFEQVISMTYKNDKLNHMKMEVNTKVTDSNIQQNWEEFTKSLDKNNEEFDKDGVSLKIERDNENYEYNTILDIDVLNASDEILKEQGFEGLKEDNSTLEDSKESAEKDGAICVIK